MKRSHKLLSLILTICIAMSMLTGFAPANAVADSTATGSEVFDLPDIVDSVEAKENDYIGRVEAEEKDLYTFVFANGDGTNTMRIYSHPVKYVADDGSIRDISLDIEAKRGGGFVTADHEIVTTFESKLTDGITLEYNDVEIMLVPALGLGTMPTAELSTDGKVVTYEMNDITSFVYELTYAGFKEDIVVEEYTGQTEYEFTLFTNGLTLCEEYGSYYLADAEGNVEATIGDIIVFTADERNNTMGSMTYETVRANQEYVLTIHLDADYLADEDTVYPIRIDPTIEINYDNNGAGAIEDVTINQNSTFSGTSGSLYVGRHPAGSLSRVLMRFPNLSLSGISANQITAATVEIRDLMCQGDEDITVECRIYNNASPAWSESGTTTWSSVGTSYLGSLLDSHVISYGQGNVGNHRYSFNILTVAKAWASGTQSPAKGLVFKANSTFENQTGDAIKTWYKTFSSYNRAENYKPSLSITYRGLVDVSVNETYLLVGGTKQINCTTNPSGLGVSWSSNNTSIATVNSSGLVTGVSEGTVKITATYTDSSTGVISSDYVYIYVKDSLGITDGKLYYIMNYSSHRFLSLESSSDSNYTNVYTRGRSTSTLSRWKTEKQSNGTFQLISDYSSSGKALDVTGTNIDIFTDNNAYYQKFSIYRVNSGTYKGYYFIRYNQYYVAQDSDYNVYLTTSLNGKSVWSFIGVEKEDADLFSFKYTGFDTTDNNTLFSSVLGNLGYDEYKWINDTASDAYNYMKNMDDVFVFRGHGEAGIIEFRDSNGVSSGAISVNSSVCSRYGVGSDRQYINSLGKNELEQLRIVLYIGCSTGTTITVGGVTYDLLSSTYDKGAQFVLGTSQKVYTPDSDAFLKGFLEALNNNSNVISCIQAGLENAGNNVLYEDGSRGQYPIVYVGDTIQYLNY